MGESLENLAAVEPPLGIFQARCDDKGRLKLPASFVEYLKSLNVDTVFITTVDMKQARIYPKKVWQGKIQEHGKGGENAKIVQDILFVANVYGGESEMDAQGRVLVPTELRRKLELEAAPVWIDFYNDRINVFGKKIYDEKMQRAMVDLDSKVALMDEKGF